MFKLNSSPTFKYPVKFSIIDENGKQKQHQIIAVFRRFNREQIIELQQRSREEYSGKDGIQLTLEKPVQQIIDEDLDYIEEFMSSWEQVDIDGDTEFSRDNLRKLLVAVPGINLAIIAAFFEGVGGGQKRKN